MFIMVGAQSISVLVSMMTAIEHHTSKIVELMQHMNREGLATVEATMRAAPQAEEGDRSPALARDSRYGPRHVTATSPLSGTGAPTTERTQMASRSASRPPWPP